MSEIKTPFTHKELLAIGAVALTAVDLDTAGANAAGNSSDSLIEPPHHMNVDQALTPFDSPVITKV